MNAPDRGHSPLGTVVGALWRRAAATEPAADETARRRRDGLDRLYVYWLISTLLLAGLAAAPALLMRGALWAQSRHIDELRRRIEDIGAAREFGSDAPASAPVARDGSHPSPAESESEGLPETVSDDAMTDLLRRALGEEAAPSQVLDPGAADEAISIAERFAPVAGWADETWIRLAMLARLSDLDGAAAEWLARSRRGSGLETDYWLLSARVKLVQGEPAEALRCVRQVNDRRAAGAVAALEAAIAAKRYDYAAIRGALTRAGPIETLAPEYRLLLARACLELDEPDLLRAVLPTAQRAPDAWREEWQFLTAALLILEGRAVEGVAALEALRGMWSSGQAEGPRREASARARRRSAPRPEPYEAALWQARGRSASGSFTASAQDFALERADRPEGWWLAGIEALRAGDARAAEFDARGALAAEPDYVPALLLLARARQATDDAAALSLLSRAVLLDGPRAETNVLLAEYHAARGDRGATRMSVRGALGRNPALLVRFRENPVIRSVLSEDELLALAAEVQAESR